jgi:hypothetical protein
MHARERANAKPNPLQFSAHPTRAPPKHLPALSCLHPPPYKLLFVYISSTTSYSNGKQIADRRAS